MADRAEGATPIAERIEALDFVRGTALFGILLMNVVGFGLPEAYTNPHNYGGYAGADLWAWVVTQVLFEGTQRALFSILFGAGVILLTGRLEAAGRTDAADIYFRRTLWLIGFGFVNAYLLLWYGDILFAYGVTALFIYSFRKLAPRALLIVGAAALIAGAAWNAADTFTLIDANRDAAQVRVAQARGEQLSDAQFASLDTAMQANSAFEATRQTIRDDLAAMRGGYRAAFVHVASLNAYWQTWGVYRNFFDVFGMMLIGMALFKLGVLTLERPTSLYAAMMIGGYGIGLVVNILEARHVIGHGFSAQAFSEANISYDLGRLTMTMGHLGALLLFVRSGALAGLRRAVAAVGRMALTSYLSQSLICSILFVGLRLYGELARHQLYYIVAAIWVFQLLASTLWLRHYRFGPAEWLWRWLTYGARPRMRRESVG